MYGVGIDLGTSFSAAAVARDGTVDMVRLGGQSTVIPSVAYLDADGTLVTGEPADRLGLAAPDRVAREFKRRLGDPTPLVLAGAPHSPTALMASLLGDALDSIRHLQQDEPPQRIVLTHPAVWGPYRREQFSAVPHLAGLGHDTDPATGSVSADPTVRLVTEPVAAATYYCAHHPLPSDGLLAVYDLGGGTFDSAVVRNGVDEMEIVGTPEGIEWLGGADFDQAVADHVDRQLSGAISSLDPADPGTAAILADLQRQCMLAKETVSTRDRASITVRLPDGSREIVLTRDAFEQMITPALETTIEAFRRTLSTSGVTPQDLAAVLLVGGSSQIPLVSTLLRDALQRPIRINTHPKHAVALGAALLSARPVPAAPPSSQHRIATSVPRPPAAATVPGAGTAIDLGRPAPRDRHRTGIGARLRGRTARFAIMAAAVVLATAALVLVRHGGTGPSGTAAGTTGAGTTTPSAGTPSRPPGAPDDLAIFGGTASDSFRLFASSADNGWIGLPPTSGTATAGTSLSLAVSGAPGQSGRSVRARWTGRHAAQFYFQAPGPEDVRAYGRSATALQFDVVVNSRPTAPTAIELHCQYPCSAQVQAAGLFRSLAPGQRATVRIPLRCFVDQGLDLGKVDVFFLIQTEGQFDASFSDIRWVPGAADLPDTPACDALG